MIGLLRGRVLHKQPPFLLLDVNGVGYELEAPMSTFYALPLGDDEITLYTHLTVREDAHILYGFSAESDRALFRALLKVNGVGGKMALGILSGMTADEFAMTVKPVLDLAASKGIEMPIVTQVGQVLDGSRDPRELAPHFATDSDTPEGE